MDKDDILVETWPEQSTFVGEAPGVRVTHKPSGMSVTKVGRRSQYLNKRFALLQLERDLREWTQQ